MDTQITVSMDKKYRTDEGGEVMLLFFADGQACPFIGTHKSVKNGVWEPGCWTMSGVFDADNDQYPNLRLVEVKPRIKRTEWVNVYPIRLDLQDFAISAGWISKARADEWNAQYERQSGTKRVACIQRDIDCEEGEGL